MKQFILKPLALVTVAVSLLSFNSKPGGEGFEIYLDGKLLVQKFGNDMSTVQNITLSDGNANSSITVKYYHCGQPGKNRTLLIKDGQDKVLKEWHYADKSTSSGGMYCSAKEIISLKRGNNSMLKLYYSSGELPAAKLLASISFGNGANP